MKTFIKLAFTLLLLLSPLLCNALNYDAQIGDYYYTFNFVSNTATVVKPISSVSNVVIPESIRYEGQLYIVDSIGAECFTNTNIRSVKLPNTIKGIGYRAFDNYYLSEVYIPNSVRYIDGWLVSNRIHYLEIGEGLCSMKNVGSSPDESKFLYSDITIVWNATNCRDYSVQKVTGGDKRQLYDNSGKKLYWYDYYRGYTPFWSEYDQFVQETIDQHLYDVSTENNVSKYARCELMYNISSFEFGNNVEHIPAYLCFKLKKLTQIIIPSSVKTIGENAFAETNLSAVTLNGIVPPIGTGGLSKKTPIYVPCQAYETYKESDSWKDMNLQISQVSYVEGCTTMQIIIGCDTDNDIISVELEGGERQDGNCLLLTNLEPNSTYKKVPIKYVSLDNTTHNLLVSFKTKSLILETLEPKPVSNSAAILLAATNLSNEDESCGFEWKRNDAPEDMTPNKVMGPVANGLMAGRLKGLKEEVYYKYRAFYQSAAGNMYYGDWKYIFTGDVSIEFDPILYTYAAIAVKENEATLKGYALAGSEDFTEQGFEYWAESRTNNAPRSTTASIGEHKTVTASGISMKATLTDLDPGTVYRYRSYANIGSKRLYGSEMTLTTQGEYKDPQAIEDIRIDAPQATKILHDGQIYILRGEKVYTITGQEVK